MSNARLCVNQANDKGGSVSVAELALFLVCPERRQRCTPAAVSPRLSTSDAGERGSFWFPRPREGEKARVRERAGRSQVVFVDAYPLGNTGSRAILTEIQASNPDVLVSPRAFLRRRR